MKTFKLNPYRIGFRTIKTAAGMAIGVIIAKQLGVINFSSAAILVVLCVKNTKMKSMQAAWARFASCLMGLIFASLVFELLGYYPVVLGLIVLLFIPATVVIGTQEGVVTACVIILHCFNSKGVSLDFILNEILLIIIGLSIALLLNLFMPNRSRELEDYKTNIEQEFQLILSEFSEALKYVDIKLDHRMIAHVQLTIEKAKSVAFMDVENHFGRNDNSYYHYFTMRGEQALLLYRMVGLINNVSRSDQLHQQLSELIHEMSQNISGHDHTAIRLHDLYAIQLQLKDHQLPTSYEAFHSRASAFQLLHELENYLHIKSKFGSLKK
ncbi:aromatic acid exporter family protein [Macrococcus carouselicus]|uniref:Aromatic acid exporter family protein n=1 Tax=Macrococcus carouselicus TaxID=69969 RepID=A0A9Q8CP39_9STAP|nr:aromatic acid exporter family protein [Macrococcus carouselicus]TDM04314.1 aromatic acid exporter family protein [Macrococcus carouselicus]